MKNELGATDLILYVLQLGMIMGVLVIIFPTFTFGPLAILSGLVHVMLSSVLSLLSKEDK